MNEMLYPVATLLLASVSAVAVAGWIRCGRQAKGYQRRLEALEAKMEELRTIDEATGALNYHTFVKTANVQIKLARRHKWPVSLMVVDIEDLEDINLRYSFKTGDAVLRHFADAIRKSIRSSDVIGRFGGSAIYILLPECGVNNINTVFQGIAQKVAADFPTQGEKRIEYTFSGGAVTMYGMQIHLNQMLELAEKALEKAKKEKRRLVVVDKDGVELK